MCLFADDTSLYIVVDMPEQAVIILKSRRLLLCKAL